MSEGLARLNEDQFGAELERQRAHSMRLGVDVVAKSQMAAEEQAAMIACHQEINRLRVELEVLRRSRCNHDVISTCAIR